MNLLMGTAPSLMQAGEQHEDSLYLAQQLAAQKMVQARRFHEEKLEFKAAQHVISARLDRQLYVTRMAHELDIARREAVRDVWKARNDNAQTMMIVESVFLAISFEILIGPKLPSAMSAGAIAAYSFFLICAILFCVISISLLLTQSTRLARYDFQRPLHLYSCGKTHRDLNDYFRCHCHTIDAVGRGFFAAAVVAILTSCAVLGGSKWWTMFDDFASGILFAAPLAVSAVVVMLGPQFFSSALPHNTVETALLPGSSTALEPSGASEGGREGATTVTLSQSVVGESTSPDFGGLRAEAREVEMLLTSQRPSARSSFRRANSGLGPAALGGAALRLDVIDAHSEGTDDDDGSVAPRVRRSNQPSPKWRHSGVRALFSRPTALGAAIDAGDEAFDAAALRDVEGFSDDDGESDAAHDDFAGVAEAMRTAVRATPAVPAVPAEGNSPALMTLVPPANLRVRRRAAAPTDDRRLHALREPFGSRVSSDADQGAVSSDASGGFYTPISRSLSEVGSRAATPL